MTGRKSTATGPGDDEVRALLDCDRCLRVPFHEVRTRFLGNIASSVLSASPMKSPNTKFMKRCWSCRAPAPARVGAMVVPY